MRKMLISSAIAISATLCPTGYSPAFDTITHEGISNIRWDRYDIHFDYTFKNGIMESRNVSYTVFDGINKKAGRVQLLVHGIPVPETDFFNFQNTYYPGGKPFVKFSISYDQTDHLYKFDFD